MIRRQKDAKTRERERERERDREREREREREILAPSGELDESVLKWSVVI